MINRVKSRRVNNILVLAGLVTTLSIGGFEVRAQESSVEPPPATHILPQAKKLKAKPRPKHADLPVVSASNDSDPYSKSSGTKQICIIDRAVVDQQASINVASNKRLQDLRSGAQASVDESRKKIEALSQANDVEIGRRPDDQALKQKRQALIAQMQGVIARAGLFSREYEATRQSVTNQLQSATTPIVQGVASSSGCSVVLARDTIVDKGDSLDISRLVIEKMNVQLQFKSFYMVDLESR